MIKPAYTVSFLISINVFVWQNVLYFPNVICASIMQRMVLGKERSGLDWLTTVVWQRKEIRINTREEKYPLGIDEDNAKHILLDGL